MNITDDMKRRANLFEGLSPLTKASILLVAEESVDTPDIIRKLEKSNPVVSRFVREIFGKRDRNVRDARSDKKFNWPQK